MTTDHSGREEFAEQFELEALTVPIYLKIPFLLLVEVYIKYIYVHRIP